MFYADSSSGLKLDSGNVQVCWKSSVGEAQRVMCFRLHDGTLNDTAEWTG